jgi:hypothetical protein
MRASPAPSGQHDSPEHDDMVVKADGLARSVNGSTAGARLAARCFRPVPRENCSESRIGSGHNIVPFHVTSAFPLYRASCSVAILTVEVDCSRYQKAAFMVGISDQASILRLLTVMHRHTCTCGPDTKVNIQQPVSYFPADCLMQASDKVCLKTAVECCFAHMVTAHHRS